MSEWLESAQNFLQENKALLFSGIGAVMVTIFWDMIKAFFRNLSGRGVVVNNIFNSNGTPHEEKTSLPVAPNEKLDLKKRKRLTNILFIDDETDFKVVKILRRNGWINTKIVKDVKSVNDQAILDADICFVDIQGVAKDLFKKDQGLGLVGGIVDNHPKKKVIVYSAQKQGNRFNALLEKAHARLPKNANPYEFENLVTNFSEEI